MNMGHLRNTEEERKDNARYRLQVKAQILNGTMANLNLIDWERITDRYEDESLNAFIRLFDPEDLDGKTELQLALIDNCLDSFKPYIQSECPLDCEEYGVEEAAFYRYAQSLRQKIENSGKYDLAAILKKPKPVIPFPAELDNDKAREYLSRLIPQFCSENFDWKDKTQKTKIAEAANILSKLLDMDIIREGIPATNWKPFEQLWQVRNLAQYFSKKMAKPISDEIAKLFPEY